ncbi:MAG: hypothetical protein M3209_15410 [Acidobacteriota bacterium]|nr:hypothetical protein [Acidobacteriota bacterium]
MKFYRNNQLASIRALITAFVVCVSSIAVSGQTTEFTYQGRLTNSTGTLLTGNYDFEFKLYNALTGGTQLGTTQQKPGVTVSNGIFTVNLDFGDQFGTSARFLEIAVRSGTASFAVLAPRQQITSAPYSIRSLYAASAADSSRLNGVSASNYVQTSDSRLSDARTPLPGSGNYIQNRTNVQPGSTSFNIDGTGTANVFNASSQFNLSGSRILGANQNDNLFLGGGAGSALDTGANGVFVGRNAGQMNSAGNNNSFFGYSAGKSNASGNDNTFVGSATGQSNNGSNNVFIGSQAGRFNTTGSNNTFIGYNVNSIPDTLQFATAIGAHAFTTHNDTIVLGKMAGTYDGVPRPADNVVVRGGLNVSGNIAANSGLEILGESTFWGNLTTDNVSIQGNLTVGNGTAIKQVLSTMISMTFTLNSNTSTTLTFSIPSASLNDVVLINPPGFNDDVFYKAHVSAAGTISVRVRNLGSSGVSYNGVQTRVTVIRF